MRFVSTPGLSDISPSNRASPEPHLPGVGFVLDPQPRAADAPDVTDALRHAIDPDALLSLLDPEADLAESPHVLEAAVQAVGERLRRSEPDLGARWWAPPASNVPDTLILQARSPARLPAAQLALDLAGFHAGAVPPEQVQDALAAEVAARYQAMGALARWTEPWTPGSGMPNPSRRR